MKGLPCLHSDILWTSLLACLLYDCNGLNQQGSWKTRRKKHPSENTWELLQNTETDGLKMEWEGSYKFPLVWGSGTKSLGNREGRRLLTVLLLRKLVAANKAISLIASLLYTQTPQWHAPSLTSWKKVTFL